MPGPEQFVALLPVYYMKGLSHDEEELVFTVRLTCSCLSLLGSLFIILVYFSVARFRSEPSFRLILYLSLSDLFFSTGMFFSTNDTEQGSPLCPIQAVIISFFGTATVLWTVIIATHSYAQIKRASRAKDAESTGVLSELEALLLCFGLAAVLTVLPFSTDSYGEKIEWCWVTPSRGRSAAIVWQLVQFYIPLWTAFAINFYCSIGFRREYLAMVGQLVGVDEKERRKQVKKARHMQWYPWVLFACWIAGTVNQLYNFSDPDGERVELWLAVLHFGLGSLQGMGNALVYGFNDEVKQELRDICRNWGGRRHPGQLLVDN